MGAGTLVAQVVALGPQPRDRAGHECSGQHRDHGDPGPAGHATSQPRQLGQQQPDGQPREHGADRGRLEHVAPQRGPAVVGKCDLDYHPPRGPRG